MSHANFWFNDSNQHQVANNLGLVYPDVVKLLSPPPQGLDPRKQGGRVPARWTYPYSGYNQPILEMPQNKSMRIALAINAWLGEPIINSASKLTIFMALETLLLTVTSHCKKIPKWIPDSEVEKYKADYGDNPAAIVAAYVKQKCLELVVYLDIKQFFENAALDILVPGDGFVNICTNASPEEERAVAMLSEPLEIVRAVEELKAKMIQDGRGQYTIGALQGLNPSAVWLYGDWAGRIDRAEVVHLMGEGTYQLNLDNLIHLKAYTHNWTFYGVSHYVSALKWVDIKFKMMDALYTNASRYVTPREWLKIEGPISPEGAKLPPTDQQMSWADEILSAWSMGQPHVLPSGWDWNLQGSEGKVLRIEMLLEKIDDAIRTGAQVSRTFTSGAANVPAYATSKLQAGIMYKAFDPLKNMIARAIEGRILRRFCLFNGFFDEDGSLIAPKVEFRTMPIQGDDSTEKKITALGSLGWLSPISAWEMEGMDPNLEMDRIKMAAANMVEPWRALSPDLSPDQTPDRYNEKLDEIENLLGHHFSAKAMGHIKVAGYVQRINSLHSVGNIKGMKKSINALNKYLAESALLQQIDNKNKISPDVDFEQAIVIKQESIKEATDAMKDPKRRYSAAVVTSEIGRGKIVNKNANGRIIP